MEGFTIRMRERIRLDKKSRVKGDFHARFREELGVKVPGLTRYTKH